MLQIFIYTRCHLHWYSNLYNITWEIDYPICSTTLRLHRLCSSLPLLSMHGISSHPVSTSSSATSQNSTPSAFPHRTSSHSTNAFGTKMAAVGRPDSSFLHERDSASNMPLLMLSVSLRRSGGSSLPGLPLPLYSANRCGCEGWDLSIFGEADTAKSVRSSSGGGRDDSMGTIARTI
jgi:hypothetical protein